MKELHPDHPDANCAPKDTRLVGTVIWTFGQNQYTSYWRAGPKQGTVVCSGDYPEASQNPYIVAGQPCSSFEKAAERARATAKAEYERAKLVVSKYEAEA